MGPSQAQEAGFSSAEALAISVRKGVGDFMVFGRLFRYII